MKLFDKKFVNIVIVLLRVSSAQLGSAIHTHFITIYISSSSSSSWKSSPSSGCCIACKHAVQILVVQKRSHYGDSITGGGAKKDISPHSPSAFCKNYINIYLFYILVSIMHIFILRKKRFSPFQDVYKEKINIFTRKGSNTENTET